MKKVLLSLLFLLQAILCLAQNTPVFNGKQLINVTSIPVWSFAERPAGWYRIATVPGSASRANATFELREDANHSTLRFQIGISYNNLYGSSFTLMSHSCYNEPVFRKIRLLTSTPYADTYLEVFVDPRNHDGKTFSAYVLNALGNVDWQLINWSSGSVPSDYSVTEFDVNKLFLVGNTPGNQVFSIGRDGNVGMGTTDPKDYKLAVNGKVRAQEIKVETANWPDYVFTKDYNLPSLKETEKHILEKGYLPGIPSAEEVKNNGIDLGEMNAKLLRKIEEMTLYLIEIKKEISVLQQRKKIKNKVN